MLNMTELLHMHHLQPQHQHQYWQLFLKCQQRGRLGLAIMSIGQLILFSFFFFLELETLGLFIVLQYNFCTFMIDRFLPVLTSSGL